jgi:hypothetical protein
MPDIEQLMQVWPGEFEERCAIDSFRCSKRFTSAHFKRTSIEEYQHPYLGIGIVGQRFKITKKIA